MNYRWILSCAAALTVLVPALGHAQGAPAPASAEGRERARTLANKGYALFEAGKHEEALKAFEEAERSFHAPTLMLMIARTHALLNHPAEARTVYQHILDEKLANYAPPEFFDAQEKARKELAALPPSDSAEAPGASPSTTPPPVTTGPEVATPVASEVPAEEPRASKGSLVPAIAAFGVAGVGLGIGAVTGLMTFSKVSDFNEACPGGQCSPSEQARLDSANTVATVSTVSFVVAGVAAAAGVTLLILRPGGQAQEQVSVVAAPGWIGARGRF